MASNSESSGFLPPRWVITNAWKGHKALYKWSGQRFGLRSSRPDREGLAQLTTIGRKSGLKRDVMIAYFEDGDDYVTMAMNGWDPAEPAWWLNMMASPRATIAIPGDTFDVVGRAATGDEHERLWNRWRELDKSVDKMSHRRLDGTAVVVFCRAD